MQDLLILANNMIQGIWEYNPDQQSVVFELGNTTQLQQQQLLQSENNNLLPAFKQAIRQILGDAVLADVVGPFGDDDIFSGFDAAGDTTYYIELCKVTEDNIAALSNLDGVIIRRPE